MPIILDEPAAPNPMAPIGRPEGLVVTRDQWSPPIREGGPPQSDLMGQRPTPTLGETAAASFRMENEVVGAIRKLGEQHDFGDEDDAHNPWESIKGTKYQDYWQAFVGSRNRAETDFIISKLDGEFEDRRIREASGWTGFATDIAASLLSPTNLLPGGAVYRGYRAGQMAARSALSVGVAAGGATLAQELMLQQQQLTRTWQESAFAVGGATLLGSLLGAGFSSSSSRALARASRQLDDDLGRISGEVAAIRASDEPPFGRAEAQSAGAARTREMQENRVAPAFGVERAFAFQSPLTRVMASEIKAARDVMSRLAEMPFMTRQNKQGVPTGPAGGAVELRIKGDGDLALYRAQDALTRQFSEYRFGNADATMAKARATFRDVTKQDQGRLGYKAFKQEVTKALRSEASGGIDHPIPQVKKAAEDIRKHVFEPFKKEAQRLGLFADDAEFNLGYVMRRYDIGAILNDRARFQQILVDWLRSGQARASSDLARLERELSKARAADPSIDVERVRQQFAAERERVQQARASAADSVKSSIDADKEWLDELAGAKPKNDAERAIYEAERLDLETRIADETAAANRIKGVGDESGPKIETEGRWPDGTESAMDRLGKSEVHYSRARGETNEIGIESLETRGKGGEGNARRLMEGLVARADRDGITLSLEPVPQDAVTDLARLKAFYASLGFVEDGKYMRRTPKAEAPRVEPQAAPEPPRTELDPAVVSAVRDLAARMGINVDDLAGFDLDGAMASLSKTLDDMTRSANKAGKTAQSEINRLMEEVDTLRSWADAGEAELKDIANETINKILGHPSSRGINPFDPMFKEGKGGPLHARTLKIPDEYIVDFLDDDIERIASAYVRAMGPDVALAREFGDINLTEELRRIVEEKDRLIEGQPADVVKRLERQATKDQNDIIDVVKRLRGTYNMVPDPTAWGPRTASLVKQHNILRLMGAVLAASISDVPKLLFTHGFRQNADLFSTLLTNYQGLKMAKAEAKELSAGLEFVLSRGGQMWDVFDDFTGHTGFERAVRVATNKFGQLTLMDGWNSTLKQLSGVMTANRVLRASVDLAAGRIKPKEMEKLAASGIGEDIAYRIADQYAKHGGVHGRLFLGNVNEWDDALARSALQSAVRREADLTIVTPGQERPLWTSGTYGSVVAQFRTFQLVSIQRTLIAGLQDVDAAKLTAISGMIGLGMLSEQLKMIIHGKENKNPPKDLGDWMYVGLANSGVLGWLTDADQMADKVTVGKASVGRLLFGHERPTSRFASQNAIGTIAGPTYGAAADVIKAVGAASTRQFSEADVHAIRRLAPYQNLFWMSRSLRAFEDGMIDRFGVPRSK